MEGASQVILRNAARLAGEPLLIVDPLRDMLAAQLQRADCVTRLTTQEFGDFQWLQAAGLDISFEPVPRVGQRESTIVVNLPREKERLAMVAHAVAAGMARTARLWLVGENRAGIRSAPRHLQAFFGSVQALDKARHCGLYEAREPIPERPFELGDYLLDWSLAVPGGTLDLRTLPGVFAHGRLDAGTKLLLQTLAQLGPAGRVLDFGCGCGVIGMALLRSGTTADVTLLDSSALALESCRRSLAANGLDAAVVASNGLGQASGRYDWIVSNPPFHRGVRNDLDVTADFIGRAGTFLAQNGKIVIVFNRHLPYLQWLQREFEQVDRLAANGEYFVAQAGNPKRRQRT